MEICNFCNRKFTENAMNRHQSECKQIHSPLSLTDSQRDGFIRKLLLQVSKMSGKMKDMQTEINYLKKKTKESNRDSSEQQSNGNAFYTHPGLDKIIASIAVSFGNGFSEIVRRRYPTSIN